MTGVCHQAFDVGAKWVKLSILCRLSWYGRLATSKGTWEILKNCNMLDLTHLAPTAKAFWQTPVNHINISFYFWNGHQGAGSTAYKTNRKNIKSTNWWDSVNSCSKDCHIESASSSQTAIGSTSAATTNFKIYNSTIQASLG